MRSVLQASVVAGWVKVLAARPDDLCKLDAGRRDVSPMSGPSIPTLIPWHENV